MRILLGAGVLGDCFGTFTDGVLGELTRQKKSHGGLNLPARDGRALVVVRQARCLGSDALKDVVDERIHDAHRLAGNSSVGMHLLQHLVDVDCVRFLPLALLFLVSLGDVLLSLAGFLGCFTAGFRWHLDGEVDDGDDDVRAFEVKFELNAKIPQRRIFISKSSERKLRPARASRWSE